MLNLSDDLVATKDVHQGHITFGGCTVFVEFEVPATASNEAKDSAFVSALAQQCEVNYLAIGSLK